MGIDSVWDWLVGLLDGWMGLVLVGWFISCIPLFDGCLRQTWIRTSALLILYLKPTSCLM